MCYNCLDEMDYGACNNSFGSLVSDMWDDSMEDLEAPAVDLLLAWTGLIHLVCSQMCGWEVSLELF